MRWISLFASSALVASSLAAPKADLFEDLHAKQLSSAPIKINDAKYGRLISAQRNYSTALLLTAMDARYGCQLCREFQPEFDLLARSWTKGDRAGESRVVFSMLDFNDGRETFMSVCVCRGS